MATFVIVHGGWGGGWEWSHVARALRSSGHEVFTPTLTGIGERSHLGVGEVVGLDTHVEDIVSVLQFEDLHDVVLCGASYGGVPVTGAADRAADRVRMIVYIDGLTPRDGEAAIDLLPQWFGDQARAGVEQHGPAWRVPLPAPLLESLVPLGSMADDARAAYLDRVRDQPVRTFLDPVTLTGAIDALPRAFVHCTTAAFPDGDDPIAALAARARGAGWLMRELATRHDPQVFDPEGIAQILVDLAT